jgi:hypothetical protein
MGTMKINQNEDALGTLEDFEYETMNMGKAAPVENTASLEFWETHEVRIGHYGQSRLWEVVDVYVRDKAA